MNEGYFGFSSMWRFFMKGEHAPDGKRGFYCKSSQKKRRKMQRRSGKGR